MDWKAAMQSEIFREFVAISLAEKNKKEAEEKLIRKANKKELPEIVEQFDSLEAQIKNDPKKLAGFRALQEKFATDPEYTAGVDNLFVEAVMLLNLK